MAIREADRTTQADAEDLIIRPVEEADLPALEWDGVYATQRRVFRSALEDAQRGERILLVALVDGQVVGQVFIQLNSAELNLADGFSRAYLYAFRVRPAWRGRGVGTQLMLAAEDELRQRGFTQAVIGVGKANPRARKLYEERGYAVSGEDSGRWRYLDDSGQEHFLEEPCWIMEKPLEPRRDR